MRSDIYSLGCTLYYMLKGQPPYRRENPALILFAHCQDPIPNLTEHVPGAPERLDALFQRMLAKKAVDRVATMAEVIAGLEACRQELEPNSRPSPEAPFTVPPALTMRLDAAHDLHEVAHPYKDELTIDLPLASETEPGPPAPISSDPLAGVLCEISGAVVTAPPEATSSGWRRTPRLWWTLGIAGLAILALAACCWIAIRGWPG